MAENNGIVGEVTNSMKDNLVDKFSSPFWSSFIISWCLWNWKFFYITFLIDSELLFQKNNILKLDYIINSYQGFFWSIGELIIFPLISCSLIVYQLPKLTIKFYEKSLDNGNEEKLIRVTKEKAFLDEERNRVETVEILKKEENIERMQSAKSQERRWEEEYLMFRASKYYKDFSFIKESIYNYAGRVKWRDDRDIIGQEYKISSDAMAYFDVNGIIEIKPSGENIGLTNKGRYFMKKFTGGK